MKVHELKAILDRHDPTADVVISTKHNRAYFHFSFSPASGRPALHETVFHRCVPVI
jgi:hypothetical protein